MSKASQAIRRRFSERHSSEKNTCTLHWSRLFDGSLNGESDLSLSHRVRVWLFFYFFFLQWKRFFSCVNRVSNMNISSSMNNTGLIDLSVGEVLLAVYSNKQARIDWIKREGDTSVLQHTSELCTTDSNVLSRQERLGLFFSSHRCRCVSFILHRFTFAIICSRSWSAMFVP